MTTQQPPAANAPTAAEDVRAAIERLKAAHAASTQGEWSFQLYELFWQKLIISDEVYGFVRGLNNLEFLAAAHNELPALFEAYDHMAALTAFVADVRDSKARATSDEEMVMAMVRLSDEAKRLLEEIVK